MTWSKTVRHAPDDEPHLRGCIGTFQATPIHAGLADFALTSALRDSRFAPIALREVPLLHCGVSLLHSFEQAPAWDAWEVGKHGVIAKFVDPHSGRRTQATFLPEVAEREGWVRLDSYPASVLACGRNTAWATHARATIP